MRSFKSQPPVLPALVLSLLILAPFNPAWAGQKQAGAQQGTEKGPKASEEGPKASKEGPRVSEGPKASEEGPKVIDAKKVSPTAIEVFLSNHQKMTFDFYADNIFRVFQDNSGGAIRDPEAKPPAKILLENPRRLVKVLDLKDQNSLVTFSTDRIKVQIDKNSTLLKIINIANNAVILEQIAPTNFEKERVTLTFKEHPQEYFYGGGVQNGRFSHKGKAIAIENQNRWTDAGVASPAPFYWSSDGYGFLWHTFKKGKYDFGAKEKGVVKLSHETNYLDAFFMVGEGAVALLNDYYQLTGNPLLLPKFGFYEGHLNAYNRDFWKEDSAGILFEDGKRYKESQKDNGGTKESLNGEKNNYQFSARAVIDRYKRNDMPLGWLLPNDGYGAGYGQTGTLDGNIQNLKSLGDYARKNGVEIGLWTQSDLHPKPEIGALLQRDILKEVKDAGVRVLKTDVAWVGAGYSFGLNGVSDVAQIMSKYGNDARPFIISLDGWAGTQRYAAVWSGDQTGGVWEYIRFHIPTYVGSGLSGLPNITSDMDGIFGGKNPIVNLRDFQWKAFTPMQLNMDGWGANEKYPHALGEPATSINRSYLKLKSELIPYSYSIAREAVDGLPMIRAMFLEYPNAYTRGSATQYQFLYGPDFLVAPIYQATKPDDKGNDIRDGIYLPPGSWVDYFTGERYAGNCIVNNFEAPVWKLPLFVKNGAIIPMTDPNNNVSEINRGIRMYEIYPSGKSSFTEYDDDGRTEQYKAGKGARTLIESEVDRDNRAMITVHPAKGDFDGFVKEKATVFRINVTVKPATVSGKIGKKEIKLTEVGSMDAFLTRDNVYFFHAAPDLNKFATKGSEFEKVVIRKNPQLFVKIGATDITVNPVIITVEGFKFEPVDKKRVSRGLLTAPLNAVVTETNKGAYTLKPTWQKVNHADFYEIDFHNMRYTTIKDTTLVFDGLTPETPYSFKLRAVNKDGRSHWTEIRATTTSNPLKFAIQGIVGETNAQNQRGPGIDRLFDYDENNLWQTRRNVKAVPFDLVMDLKSYNQLDKFHYLPPRTGRGNGNGIILKGKVFYSNTKENWAEAGSFEWSNNDETKIFNFTSHPSARYIRMTVTGGVGDAGAGRELYVFKVPGTESYLPGDINNDHLIDWNDLTSYMNYTGLRKGDADFEGYISKGDINQNNLIDAYDISVVATQLGDGVDDERIDSVAGKLEISTAKQTYNKDEVIRISVKGAGLTSVNALSFALPYNPQDYDFVGVESLNVKQMDNLTVDRLHTGGTKAVYVTFVNVGNKEALAGNAELFVLKLKAKRPVNFDLKPIDGILVDKNLATADPFKPILP
jgi:alpha-glucosidase (family GH31 glycosyl hydrolase)